MCGDPYSTAPTVDSGDLLAIIHPTTPTQSFAGARLHLSNKASSGATRLTLSYSSSSSSASCPPSVAAEYEVRIHQFGSPLSTPLPSSCSSSPSSSSNSSYFEEKSLSPVNPVWYAFPAGSQRPSAVGRRLNLGVGGDGIVGRTVSLVSVTGEVMGEGVIGWG